jgi:hypothetical protein
MPYVAFPRDTVVLTKPTVGDLKTLAEKKPSSITIFEYPFDSLKPIGVLAGLEVLKIQDSGALRTLDGIAVLNSLKNLVISTPPTWDGTAPKARKWLCPKCNEKKLKEHVQAWEAAKGSAS